MSDEIRPLKPSIRIDSDLLALLAIDYVSKLPHFRGLKLTTREEIDVYFDCPSGNLLVESNGPEE